MNSERQMQEQMVVYRRYLPGDEHEIIQLHNRIFEAKIDIDFWRWLFVQNPVGRSHIWIAKTEDGLVGHFAAFPVRMEFGNRMILGSKSCLTMTHPNFRRQRIFLNLSKRLFGDLSERNILITIGNPNKNSYFAFTKKASYKNPFGKSGVPYLVKPLRIENILTSQLESSKISISLVHIAMPFAKAVYGARSHLHHRTQYSMSDVKVGKAFSFDDRFNVFWDRVSHNYKIVVVRDKEYLCWRYSQCPRNYAVFTAENNGDVSGYMVLRERNLFNMRVGLIVDILVDSKNMAACYSLLKTCEDYFRKKGADVIACLMLRHHFCYAVLKKFGFQEIPRIVRPRNFYYAVHFNDERLDTNFANDPHNWYLTWGDAEDG